MKEIGVSAIIRDQQGRYIFGIQGLLKPHICNRAFFSGIGGHVEADESGIDAVKRELLEEIGVECEIRVSDDTYEIFMDGNIRKYKNASASGEYIKYNYSYSKCQDSELIQYLINIFQVDISFENLSLNKEEVSGLIAVDKETLIMSLDNELTYDELILSGAIFFNNDPINEISDKRFFPIGTARAIGEFLKSKEIENILHLVQ